MLDYIYLCSIYRHYQGKINGVRDANWLKVTLLIVLSKLPPLVSPNITENVLTVCGDFSGIDQPAKISSIAC